MIERKREREKEKERQGGPKAEYREHDTKPPNKDQTKIVIGIGRKRDYTQRA